MNMKLSELTQDEDLPQLDNWDGTVGQLFTIAERLNVEYGPSKRIIMDAGHNSIWFRLDNSDVREKERAAIEAASPKKLSKTELEESKNRLILQLLGDLGIKLTKREINKRITTGKGFDDLLKK
jgi:hypothetical protein